jgi:hypothetical protein
MAHVVEQAGAFQGQAECQHVVALVRPSSLLIPVPSISLVVTVSPGMLVRAAP